MGQGRKPKPRRPDFPICPHCGGELLLDTQHETMMDDVTASDSFMVLRDGSIVKLNDDHPRVTLGEEATALGRGQAVTVKGARGVIAGFSRDHDHVYVRFGKHARKVDVDEVIPG